MVNIRKIPVAICASIVPFFLIAALISCGGSSTNTRGGTAGGTWVPIPTAPPNISAADFFFINTNGDFYVAGESASGLYRSRDHGQSWQRVDVAGSGFLNQCHWAMVSNGLGEPIASEQLHNNVPGCSTSPDKVYRLKNGQSLWTPSVQSPNWTGGSQMPYLVLGTGAGARILVGGTAQGGVWISDDDGASFQICPGCPGIVDGAVAGESFNFIEAQNGDIYMGTAGLGIWRSVDRGDHWTQLPCNGGLNCAGGVGNKVDSAPMQFAPRSGDLIVTRGLDSGSVACFGPLPPGPGSTWKPCDNGLHPGTGVHPNSIHAGLVKMGFLNGSKTTVFLAANNGGGHIPGLYSSTNGVNWTRAESGLPSNPSPINFIADPTTGLLYVLLPGTQPGAGVYHTTVVP